MTYIVEVPIRLNRERVLQKGDLVDLSGSMASRFLLKGYITFNKAATKRVEIISSNDKRPEKDLKIDESLEIENTVEEDDNDNDESSNLNLHIDMEDVVVEKTKQEPAPKKGK
jgi:hypothetical protein